MSVMPMMLGGFSIPHSLSFLEGFSYAKNNGYLGVIMHLSEVFNSKTQLNDALIESYQAGKRTLDNLLESDRGVPEIGSKGKTCIPNS